MEAEGRVTNCAVCRGEEKAQLNRDRDQHSLGLGAQVCAEFDPQRQSPSLHCCPPTHTLCFM